jgi:hypothetical protein
MRQLALTSGFPSHLHKGGVRNLTPAGALWGADLREDAVMADCWRASGGCSWRAPGGWRVRVVRLEGTPNSRDGAWLRVTQFGFWTADVRSVAELSRFFPVDTLEPDDGLRGRPNPRMARDPVA